MKARDVKTLADLDAWERERDVSLHLGRVVDRRPPNVPIRLYVASLYVDGHPCTSGRALGLRPSEAILTALRLYEHENERETGKSA